MVQPRPLDASPQWLSQRTRRGFGGGGGGIKPLPIPLQTKRACINPAFHATVDSIMVIRLPHIKYSVGVASI